MNLTRSSGAMTGSLRITPPSFHVTSIPKAPRCPAWARVTSTHAAMVARRRGGCRAQEPKEFKGRRKSSAFQAALEGS